MMTMTMAMMMTMITKSNIAEDVPGPYSIDRKINESSESNCSDTQWTTHYHFHDNDDDDDDDDDDDENDDD